MTQNTTPYGGAIVYRRLLKYSARHWRIFIVAVIGMMIIAFSQLLFAKFIEPMLDDTFIEKDAKVIMWVPVVLIAIYAIRVIGAFLSSYCMAYIARSVIRSLRTTIFDHYLRLPTSFFDINSSGTLVSKMIYDVEQLADAASNVVTVLIRDSMTIIVLLAFMFLQSAKLTLFLLICLPFLTVVVVFVGKRFRRISHRIQHSMGDVSSVTEEVIEASREIKIFGGHKYESERFGKTNTYNWQQYLKYHATVALSSPVIELIVASSFAAVLYYVTQPGMIENMSPGKFMSFLTAMLLLMQHARPLASVNAQLQRGIAAAQSVFELIDRKTESDQGTKVLDHVKGIIEYKDVNFSYSSGPAAKTVLRNINFSIENGQSVAFVGRSGSGKTTLVNLLPKFYELLDGDIFIDHHNIRDIQLDSLRSHIALVSQHVTLFNDTIKHNIAYGSLESATQEDIERAARAAHAMEFIQELPDGFDTVVGENGVLLSGGQRQRLAIARAILKDAPILILDEATSALDTESERFIQDAMKRVMQNRTTLVIAHRLSTIESVDKIIVLDDGRIVETGNHTELLAKRGAYFNLHKLQFSGDKA